ncbi:hypothetical protein C1645_825511 [Glomus cerebriforme]|uniref:Something about silencing protein 4 domain-containing protein n=1 Tax=Glomus cerebriforme TaxID=658196 RepID=A0A397SS49_9GLOM|nr:hypothetical protein C1645_825511 [Glomus cerebriforme]
MPRNNLDTVQEQVDIDIDVDSVPHERDTPDSIVTTSSSGGNDEHNLQETKTSKRVVGKKRRRSPALELSEENITQGIAVSETSEPNPKKRVLPPRKVGTLASVLADEVAADQAALLAPVISGETTILLTSDESFLETCDVVVDDEDEDLIKANNINDKEISVPSFRIVNGDISGLRSKAQEEDISDVAYEKRHRKHELAEKKLRNREREKLAYERYQQQLAVEKLRNTDSKNLISVAALRNKDATSDANKLQIAHQKLLKEAEDTLAIYDSFGLGGKKRKADATINEGEGKVLEEPESKRTRLRGSKSIFNVNSDDIPPKPKEETLTRITRSRKKKNDELASKASTITKKPAKPSQKGKKALNSMLSSTTAASTLVPTPSTGDRVTSFVRPRTGMASGSRKSTRSAFAFGERVPTRQMNKKDFVLPDAIFGEMINQREQLRTLEIQDQRLQSEEYKMSSENGRTR